MSDYSVTQTTPIRRVHRASEVRDQELGHSSGSQISPGYQPYPSPTVRPLEAVQFPTPEKPPKEDIRAALLWSTRNFNNLVEVPDWQQACVDLTHSQTDNSDEVSLPQLQEPEVNSRPSVSQELGEVLKIELSGRVLVRLQDGTTVWLPISKDASMKFTFNT